MDVGQQVHMVSLTTELQQLAAPIGEYLGKGVAQVFEDLG